MFKKGNLKFGAHFLRGTRKSRQHFEVEVKGQGHWISQSSGAKFSGDRRNRRGQNPQVI